MALEERICRHCSSAFMFNATSSTAIPNRGVFCSGICQRRGRHQRQLTDSFTARTSPKTAIGCILWTGIIRPDGYGSLSSVLAHRISWELHRGPIPDGLHVLHTCDVRNCVNPDHLFLGTNYDNIKDKLEKQRHAKGEAFHRKLTGPAIAAIRLRYRTTWDSQTKIAKDMGVTQSHISRILNRQTWKHL